MQVSTQSTGPSSPNHLTWLLSTESCWATGLPDRVRCTENDKQSGPCIGRAAHGMQERARGSKCPCQHPPPPMATAASTSMCRSMQQT